MKDQRIIDLFNKQLECLGNSSPFYPRTEDEKTAFLCWFSMGYGCGFETQEHRIAIAKECLEFYSRPSSWGIDKPGANTSIDPCDQECLENEHTISDIRGGKKAREAIRKIFKEHCDRMKF